MLLSGGIRKVLVIGGSGFIGGAFVERYAPKYRMRYTYHDHHVDIPKAWGRSLSLRSEAKMCELISEFRPDIVLHTAALTSTGACEKDWERAYDLNVRATQELVRLATDVGARTIFLSTDFVFDGDKGFYEETDHAYPRTRYGRSKRMAEEIVLDATGGRNTVLRLSLVYGWGRKGGRRGFIGWLQDSLIEGRPVTLFIDEMRSPVYLEDVVDVMNECIEQNISGLYHIGGWESINRYDFGLRFAETMGYNPSCLVQASIKDFSGMPPRPRDLTLNTHRAQDTFQTILGGVDDGLRRMRQRFDHPEGEPRPKKLRPPRIAEDNPESSGS